MKKIGVLFAGVMLLLVMSCQMNPENDDFGYGNGASGSVSTEVEKNTPESSSDKDNNCFTKPEGEYLDLTDVSIYEFETQNSVYLWSENAVAYEILEGEEYISLDAENKLTALFPGEAKIRTTTTDGFYYYLYVTVTAAQNDDDSETTGNTVINPLVGKWFDDDSFIEFYADGSGFMKVYLKGKVVQEVSFNWSDFSNSYGHFLVITNANDYLNKQYTITVSESSMTLKGNLAFGKPQTTTWKRQ